jgi:ligand-binding sensor domain-containing protein/signal transduction histidine kinase
MANSSCHSVGGPNRRAIRPDHRPVRACRAGTRSVVQSAGSGCTRTAPSNQQGEYSVPALVARSRSGFVSRSVVLSGIEFARQIARGSVFLLALTLPALALNPAYQISQYAHTSWTHDKGINAVRRIKQAPNSYLWLATRTGLLRFDGVRITTFKAGPEDGLESSTTQDLVFDPDGSIWVATLGGGLAHYQKGRFHTYRVKDGLPADDIGCIYRDSRGTLWVGTWGAGIARMVNGQFEKLPLAIPPSRITALLESADHSLWIATEGYGIFRLQNGNLTSFTVTEGLPDNRLLALYLDHAGTVWTAGWKGISSWNGARFVAQPTVNALLSRSQANSCIEDRNGNLWVASPSGLFRAHGEEVSQVDSSTVLSSDYVSDVYEDREGNIWAGTRGGVDRFRDGQVQIVLSRQKGPIVADNQGVWMASNQQIKRIAAGTVRTWPLSLPPGSAPFTLLAKPAAGLLIGFDKGIGSWTSEHAYLTSELSGLHARCFVRAHDGSIWIGTSDRGLLRWAASAGSRSLTETGVPDRFITTLAEDRKGAIWAGSISGGLYRLAGGNVQHFGRDEGLLSPEIYALFVDGNGELWIGSVGGLSWFQNGRIYTVNSQQGLPADQVFAILDDSYDRLWFTGFAGIAAIDKKSLADWAAGQRPNLNPILYGSAQGIQMSTVERAFPDAARTPDGHLWFSIENGLAEVTPPPPGNSRPLQFPVLVEDVIADGVPGTESGRLRIAPGTRSVELRYTALTLSDAEVVRFRYRLEGLDNDWVYADTRRLAFYNNLKPGAYTFRVAAHVGEEQWKESPALLIEQLPFFYQTWEFMLLASAAALSLAIFAYWLRIRQITQEFNARLKERVGERTRIARDFHDSTLQNFQAVLMGLSALRYLIPERPDVQGKIEGVCEQARNAITEGRDAIQGLRSSTLVANDLARAISMLGEGLAADQNGQNSPEFRVSVGGNSKDLPPLVRDEVFWIAAEALRNAFRHAQAKGIEVEIRYGPRQFRLRVLDDGKGIDQAILKVGGRTGHHGLPGINERAELAGGKLCVWSQLDSGTRIELTIPASIAYRRPASRAAATEKETE